MSLIELQNINFSYSNNLPEYNFRLENINLVINSGEFITILGPNGSGKSTLLKIINGLLKPRSGKITFNGKPFSASSRKELARKIAFVPQNPYSIYPFSVYEIVMMGRTPYLNLWGFEKSEDKEKVNEALNIVGITHLKNKGVNEISGGEAQRTFIARALVQEPDVLLLDEPNSHLDLEHQIAIFNLLQKLNLERNLTLLMVSHDLNLAGCYGSRAVLMKAGKVFMDDNKENILTQENIKSVFKVNAKVLKDLKNNYINIAVEPTT